MIKDPTKHGINDAGDGADILAHVSCSAMVFGDKGKFHFKSNAPSLVRITEDAFTVFQPRARVEVA
jgi:hypothetical protein